MPAVVLSPFAKGYEGSCGGGDVRGGRGEGGNLVEGVVARRVSKWKPMSGLTGEGLLGEGNDRRAEP